MRDMSEEQKKSEENTNEGIDIPTIPSLRERIIATLKTCYDPEIPVDIWELGLIYEIRINDGNDVHKIFYDIILD
jgi:metal-sulfur cluster biosynthetic enzyme